MGILQPVNDDQLKDLHPLMHKVFAIFSGAPVQHVIVDADGNIYIGDYPHGNFFKIDANQQVKLVGDTRVKRHMFLDPARFKLPAANYPGESFEGLYYTLNFDKLTEQSANAQNRIPYRWDPSTDIEVVIRWLHDSVDAGKVVWGVEYKAIKAGEAVAGGGTTISQASAGNHPAGELVETTFTIKILKEDLERADVITVRLFRDVADGDDTLGEDARMVDTHFNFVQNRIGKAV